MEDRRGFSTTNLFWDVHAVSIVPTNLLRVTWVTIYLAQLTIRQSTSASAVPFLTSLVLLSPYAVYVRSALQPRQRSGPCVASAEPSRTHTSCVGSARSGTTESYPDLLVGSNHFLDLIPRSPCCSIGPTSNPCLCLAVKAWCTRDR